MTDYEKYQLQWMIDHGYSLKRLAEELDRYQFNTDDGRKISIVDLFNNWEKDCGFSSEIWACEDEWWNLEGQSLN